MNDNSTFTRLATKEDVPALANLMNELGYPTTVAEMEQRFALLQTSTDYLTWVAICNNEVAGMIGLVRNIYFEKNGLYIRVGALVVNNAYRKIGLGKALLQKATDWAVENGITQIYLNSGNRNERIDAHAFYKHLGFEPRSTGFVKTL
ncbi:MULTISPECIES: GNAT family N-acetyltransferase [Niastella]|uniref:GNAT family N-acetyltransferase n=1 Tax=Niastella soli TaxID=2821487 RepID=A0ABS3YPE2_9BACT|nr:GNAT family N-acetyltransferase [Niastella soli]MBO9199719.1 GNAT family N-acetyltransferase [Niastella soli]